MFFVWSAYMLMILLKYLYYAKNITKNIFQDKMVLVFCVQNACGCHFCMQYHTTQHKEQTQMNKKSIFLKNNPCLFFSMLMIFLLSTNFYMNTLYISAWKPVSVYEFKWVKFIKIACKLKNCMDMWCPMPRFYLPLYHVTYHFRSFRSHVFSGYLSFHVKCHFISLVIHVISCNMSVHVIFNFMSHFISCHISCHFMSSHFM